jgi:hypothetical protein
MSPQDLDAHTYVSMLMKNNEFYIKWKRKHSNISMVEHLYNTKGFLNEKSQ